MPLNFFLKLRMAFEHAGILTLMADIMARTLLLPLTISRIGTLPKIHAVDQLSMCTTSTPFGNSAKGWYMKHELPNIFN